MLQSTSAAETHVLRGEESPRESDEGLSSSPETPEGSKKNAFGDAFRNYVDSVRHAEVRENYKQNHENQTVLAVKQLTEKWLTYSQGEHTCLEVIELLDSLVDDSDPDNNLPNSIHDFQTAERIRKAFPGEEYDWFHLTGLLHDLGKVMSCWGESQWAVVGDTFPVGCKPADSVVFKELFEGNPDSTHPVYSTENGIYEPGCGIENLIMSWGHDEYMYWVLKEHGCTLPDKALAMIRYHSFYPWHTSNDYTQFESPTDAGMKKWVQLFNQFDLYSKSDDLPEVSELLPYYTSLLEKYNIGGKLRW